MAVKETVFEIEKRQNYGEQISVAKGKKLHCYSKKQMKSIYPKDDYEIIAERVKKSKKEPIAVMSDGSEEFPIYKNGTHKHFYSPKGFLAIKDQPNGFVAVLKNMLPVYLIIVILIIAVACGIWFTHNAFNPSNPASLPVSDTTESKTADTDDNAIALGSEPTTEKSNSGAIKGISIPGFKSITIAANTKDVTVKLENPAENNCYFVMRIVLLDTNKTLYETKMVAPGKGVYNIKLKNALKAGTYKAQLQYETYNMKTLSRLNGAVVNFDLIAK